MDDEIREDVEAPVSEPAEKAKTNAALRTFAQQSFLSKALFFVSAECIYEYYITFSFVGLMLRALQVVRPGLVPHFFPISLTEAFCGVSWQCIVFTL